jgi:hypothetical protein
MLVPITVLRKDDAALSASSAAMICIVSDDPLDDPRAGSGLTFSERFFS